MSALVALVLALLCAASSCGRDPRPAERPAEQAADESPRIVALSPALAVTLRDLGLGDRIVARHDYDFVTPKDVPTAGHQEAIDYERLLAARPTHVLLQWGRRELPPRLADLGEQHDWIIKDFPLTSLEEVHDAAGWIYENLAEPSADAALPDDPREILDRALRPDPALAGAGRVLLLADTDPPAAVGPGSFHHDVLARIGGAPALASGSPWIRLDAEGVLRLAPDAIVLLRPRGPGTPEPTEPTWEEIEAMLGRLAGLDIPAVRSRRVALIDDPLVFIPAPGPLADFAEELRRRLEEWSVD